jgi:4-hydroxybenzoate polyprenyltransferase
MDAVRHSTHSDADAAPPSASALPALCVDLDGTLVKSDTLSDSICILAHHAPWRLAQLPLWLLRGRAYFKAQLAAQAMPDPAHLPYNAELMIYLRQQAAAGRTLVLATGADHRLAEGVAQHTGLFHAVLASDGTTNLTGKQKLRLLEERFGPGGFDYIGNSHADVPLLRAAATALLANPARGLRRRVLAQRNPGKAASPTAPQVFLDRAPRMRTLLRTLRTHQWAKNALLFLPLLLAHKLRGPSFARELTAFLCFCCVASATYILNDMLDMEADRQHPRKRTRPFAAGDLRIPAGAALGIVLAAGALAVSLHALPEAFSLWLGIYAVSTLAYSLRLKRRVLIDVLLLSALYTLRILAGAAAVRVPVSPWMAAFAIFFFFSLALVKRFSELENLRLRGAIPANGRGYRVQDLEQLRSFGTASAYASIVIFALYINNPEVGQLYRHPHRLWLMTPVLLWWLSRIWLKASRAELEEDPVVFALTDRASLLAGLLMAAIAIFAAL